MAELIVDPSAFVVGCQQNQNLVQFEHLLPVCSSLQLSCPQTSSVIAISADVCGNIFVLNLEDDSVMIMKSVDYDSDGNVNSTSWYELVIVRNAVTLAVGNLSLWVVTATGDINFIRLRRGRSVQAATQKLITGNSIADAETKIVCVTVNDSDRVFVGTGGGQIYSSSSPYRAWCRLPSVNKQSWISSIFGKSEDRVIHCMTACVNGLYCCIGSNYDLWRYTFGDSVTNGEWQNMKLTKLELCCLSGRQNGASLMLLGVDAAGTLFVYSLVDSSDDSDWVEVSSENWSCVAIGHKKQQTMDSSDDEMWISQNKKTLTEESGDSSSDEYVTARDPSLLQRQLNVHLKTMQKNELRMYASSSEVKAVKQSTSRSGRAVGKKECQDYRQTSAVVATKHSSQASTLHEIPFQFKPRSAMLSCLSQIQVPADNISCHD
jgi:hypothetical protein